MKSTTAVKPWVSIPKRIARPGRWSKTAGCFHPVSPAPAEGLHRACGVRGAREAVRGVVGIDVRPRRGTPLRPVPDGVVAVLPEADARVVDDSQLPRGVVSVRGMQPVGPLEEGPRRIHLSSLFDEFLVPPVQIEIDRADHYHLEHDW